MQHKPIRPFAAVFLAFCAFAPSSFGQHYLETGLVGTITAVENTLGNSQ
jgi:hypothetical protein